MSETKIDSESEPIKVYIPKGTSKHDIIEHYNEYNIHDNGRISYIVRVVKNDNYSNEIITVFKHEDIIISNKTFIGESPKIKMTEYSEAYGDQFTGNTILIKIGDNRYKHIGKTIIEFITEHEIIKFVSPIGNNDVPYPYAIDIKNNYYLIIEGVIIMNNPLLEKFLSNNEDPYTFYYKNDLITEDIGLIPRRKPIIDMGISEFYIDNDQFTMRYRNEIPEGKMQIIRTGSDQKEDLSTDAFVQIMNEFKQKLGIAQMMIV